MPYKIKIKHGITMNSEYKHPPLDIIDKLTVRRVKTGEYGPLDLFKIIKTGKRYKINFNYEKETISVHSTNDKLKYKKLKNNIPVSHCKPLVLKKYKWYNPGEVSETLKDKLGGTGSGDANVFGDSGFLQINRKHDIDIPFINILDCEKEMYDKFGVKIYNENDTLPKLKGNKDIFLVSYRINENFASQYVHHSQGPGIFLEYHDFPHYFTPISQDYRGPVVVGKFNSKKELELIGLNIPIGKTVYFPPNLIHNDWYVVGKVATTVSVDESNTVFLRGFNAKKIAMHFGYKPISTS
jgi:hypothetical protein